MKTSALIIAFVASSLLLVGSSGAAIAGQTQPIVPEPSTILIWAGIAGAGGVAYWWHKRR